MKFALFYEIPVARPWDRESELRAYHDTIEQAVAGEKYGWDAFWTVEHHFLQEYSHCSNPEVLYGAIAAQDRAHPARLRRAAHAEAVQPPGPLGRVRRGARPDLERPGRLRHRPLVHPRRARGLRGRPAPDPRDVGRGDRPHRRLLDRGRGRARTASTGRCRSAACSPSRSRTRTRRSTARRPARTATARSASMGLGLCSFAVGVPPEEVKKKIDIYREAVRGCTEPVGKFVNDSAATFTMTCCAPDQGGGVGARPRVLRVVPEGGRPAHRRRWPSGWPRRTRTSATTATPRTCRRPTRAACSTCSPRVPGRERRLRARHPRRLPRDVPQVRGGRRRPAALPRQPVQDPARGGHADDPADGRGGHPQVQVSVPGLGPAGHAQVPETLPITLSPGRSRPAGRGSGGRR